MKTIVLIDDKFLTGNEVSAIQDFLGENYLVMSTIGIEKVIEYYQIP